MIEKLKVFWKTYKKFIFFPIMLMALSYIFGFWFGLGLSQTYYPVTLNVEVID